MGDAGGDALTSALKLYLYARGKADDEIAVREALIDGNVMVGGTLGVLHTHRVIFGEVTFIDQLADLFHPEIVVALIDGDLVDPRQEGTAEVEVAIRGVPRLRSMPAAR